MNRVLKYNKSEITSKENPFDVMRNTNGGMFEQRGQKQLYSLRSKKAKKKILNQQYSILHIN